MRLPSTLLVAVAAFTATVATTSAEDVTCSLERVLAEQVPAIISADVVIAAIRAQNDATAAFDQAAIDSLDNVWRGEVDAGNGPMIGAALAKPCSLFLQEQLAASDGLFNEIFVMDARGLNVGLSNVTSDYWQGDEAKWQQTYAMGAGATFIDDIQFDESTGQFQAQISATIVDPVTNAAIGAITFGVNVEKL